MKRCVRCGKWFNELLLPTSRHCRKCRAERDAILGTARQEILEDTRRRMRQIFGIKLTEPPEGE